MKMIDIKKSFLNYMTPTDWAKNLFDILQIQRHDHKLSY